MGEGRRFDVTGTQFSQRPTPETFESNYYGLDFGKGTGHLASGSSEVYAVTARVNAIGAVLEDYPLDGQWMRTMTVVPYKMGHQERFPAAMHEVAYDDSGLTATIYVGACAAIPAS